MKKLKKLVCVASILMIAANIAVCAESQTVLIENGDFSQATQAGWAKEWSKASAASDLTNYRSEGGVDNSAYVEVSIASTSGSNVCMHQVVEGMDASKTYKLTFWYKTDASNNPRPHIRMKHNYENAGGDTISMELNFTATNSISCSSLTSSAAGLSVSKKTATNVSDVWPDSTPSVWEKRELCFAIPNYTGAYAGYDYKTTTITFGMSASTKASGEETIPAIAGYDNISLTEAVSGVTFLNADKTDTLNALPSDSTVNVNVEYAGVQPEIAPLVGLYKYTEENIPTLVEILSMEKKEVKSAVTFGANVNLGTTLYMPNIASFDVKIPELDGNGKYALKVMGWETFGAVKPLMQMTELVTAAQ